MLHHQAGSTEQIERDADEAVDGDLGHDAAHQRGDMAGRCRMRERKPDMQRNEAGLGAGADQCEAQHQRSERGRGVRRANGGEGIIALWPGK